MQQIYSPLRNPKARPNKIHNILSEVQPEIAIINASFQYADYENVVHVYEKLSAQYNYFEIDLSKIAFSYYKLGRHEEAKNFILGNSGTNKLENHLLLAEIYSHEGHYSEAIRHSSEAFDRYSSPEAALLLAEAYKHTDELKKEALFYLMALLKLDVHKPPRPVVRFKVFSELARLAFAKREMEDARYYLFMCFSYMETEEDINTPEFTGALSMLSDSLNALLSQSLRSMIHEQNKLLGNSIARFAPNQYKKICGSDSFVIDVAEYSKELLEDGTTLIDRARQRILEKGDYVIRSITEHLIEEQPTFVYSYSD